MGYLLGSRNLFTYNDGIEINGVKFPDTSEPVEITFNNVRDEIAQIVKVKKIIDVDDSDLHIAADYRSNGFSYLANKDVPKVYIEYIKGSYPQGKARLDKVVQEAWS